MRTRANGERRVLEQDRLGGPTWTEGPAKMNEQRRLDRARYVIHVRWHQEPNWAAWFGGFTVSHESPGNTILIGELVDDAALSGFMSQARALGLTVVAIIRRAG